MRICSSVVVIVAAAVSLHAASGAGAPAAEIAGTVKVTGVASNADAVVYVQDAKGGAAPAKPLVMDQSKMQFVPHVLAVPAGASVKFLNDDPTPHNVFSPDNEKFNLGTWPQGQSKNYEFNKCTKFPCVYTLLCRVHPEMEGYIVVLQNSSFAVTGKDGRYEIEGVPAGTHTVAVWHAKAKAQPKPVTVEPGKPVTVDFVLAR